MVGLAVASIAINRETAAAGPTEDCVPAGSLASAVLAAARTGVPVEIETASGQVLALRLRISTDFPWEAGSPGAVRPYSLSGPIHFFRQLSLEPGTTTVAGFVKCDYVYGVVNLAEGGQLEFGEMPVLVSSPRHDHTLPIRETEPTSDTSMLPKLPPPTHNSINVLKHIYNEAANAATDPVNVVFYDTIRPTLRHILDHETINDYYDEIPTHCYRNLGWNNAWVEDHPAHFWDAWNADGTGGHGGQDYWLYADEEWGSVAVDTCDHQVRDHMRIYESRGGDTHNPGFKGYILAPVHRDGGDPDDVRIHGPDDGQDYLWALIYSNHHRTRPPMTVLVPTTTDPTKEECPGGVNNCEPPEWTGEIDLYEMGSNDAGNPEEGTQCGSIRATEFPVQGGVKGLRLHCQASPFDATFSRVRGNEWWVQADVATNGPVLRTVQVRINDGNWLDLTKQSWGAWAASYHIVQGATVQLRAIAWGEDQDVSSCYRWIPPVDTDASIVSCTYPFDATFTNPNGNDWWVAVTVTANKALAGVDARVNCGTWIPLVKQTWGEWAKSFNVPANSKVDFQARATNGETDRSGGYIWPLATPTSPC